MDYKNRRVAELVALISQEMAKTGLQKKYKEPKGSPDRTIPTILLEY